MGKKKAGKSGAASKADEEDIDAILDEAVAAVNAERTQALELSGEGDLRGTRGDWGTAIERYTQAIAVDPNNGSHFCKRSFANMSLGRGVEALADAQTAVSLGGLTSEETANCCAQLGTMLLEEDKVQAASEAFDKGLKFNKNNQKCREGLAAAGVRIERHAALKSSASVQLAAGDIEAQDLKTLPAPEEVLGKGFEVVHLRIGTFEKPVRFLLCTTLAEEAIITPNTCSMLGHKIGTSLDLEDVRFDGGHPIGTLRAVPVTGFVQAQIASRSLHSVIHGMLGRKFLERFDFDLDRVRSIQHFKEAGRASGSGKQGVRIAQHHFPSMSLPGGLIGVPMHLQAFGKTLSAVGIIDTGSMFSTINWQAAKELGMPTDPNDSAFDHCTKVAGATISGVAEMPLTSIKVKICSCTGDPACRATGVSKEEFEALGKGNGWDFDYKAAGLKPAVEFGRVNAAIGDAIQFEMLRDSAVGAFQGAAVLLGQDVLSQAPRFTFSAKDKELWLDQPSRVVDAIPF